jgi:hypothetical protein
MDKIGEWVSRLGGFAALAGLISSGLHFINYELRILMWIESWGPTTAWVIRGALVAGGAALYFVGNMLGNSEQSSD